MSVRHGHRGTATSRWLRSHECIWVDKVRISAPSSVIAIVCSLCAVRQPVARPDPPELPWPRHPTRCTDPCRGRRRTGAEGLRWLGPGHPRLREKTCVGRRFVKNDRLMAAGFLWAFAALQCSVGANEDYRRRRSAGDWHAAAQRNLFNRLLGQRHHCIQTRSFFDEARAFVLAAPGSTELSSGG